MSKVLFGVLFAALVAVIGCDQSKQTAGSPGATTSGEKPPLYGQKDDTFNLTLASQSVKQGDAKELTVGIKRGTNFDQDVGISFVDLPAGVTATPAASALKHGDADAKIILTAAVEARARRLQNQAHGPPDQGGRCHNRIQADCRTEGHVHLKRAIPFALAQAG